MRHFLFISGLISPDVELLRKRFVMRPTPSLLSITEFGAQAVIGFSFSFTFSLNISIKGKRLILSIPCFGC